jgi:hypothetical protein
MATIRINLTDLPEDARVALTYFYWYPSRTTYDLAKARRFSAHRAREVVRSLLQQQLVVERSRRYQLTTSGRAVIERHRQLEALRSRDSAESLREESQAFTDPHMQHAISVIADRADRRPNESILAATFVDPGLTGRLDNQNNHIIYGRRGTGKTHILHVLHRNSTKWPSEVATYIDMRQLGTPGTYEDDSRPLHTRVISLLRAVLTEIQNDLMDVATHPRLQSPRDAIDAIERLADALTRSALVSPSVTLQQHSNSERLASGDLGAAWAAVPVLRFGTSARARSTEGEQQTREGIAVDHINFQEISHCLSAALKASRIERYVLLLDEWSAVPLELQPWLADFIRRVVFVIPTVTVKIAALEYRSRFSESRDRNELRGFELGAEITSSVHLDDYFVFDRNRASTEELFAEMLYRHLAVELDAKGRSESKDIMRNTFIRKKPADVPPPMLVDGHVHCAYLAEMHDVESARGLVDYLFASPLAFRELVRAAEGVARDFIVIFNRAYFDVVRRDGKKIDVPSIRHAARLSFDEKIENVTDEQSVALEKLVDRVLRQHRARSFLVEHSDQDDIVRSLFDFRLLHLVQRGFFEDTKPTKRYHIYTLDYGLYAALLDTSQEPLGDFTAALRELPETLALDNDRWIRRIVIDPVTIM